MEPKIDNKPKTDKIEDATIISETKTEPKIQEQKTNQVHGTIEVDSNDGKKKIHEKVTIDFMDEGHLKGHIKKQTSFVKPETPKPEITIEQAREQIKIEEKAASEKWTVKDFEQIAGFLINLVDTGISIGFRFWAKDTSDTAYSLPEPKKKMLTEQLALILIKYNAKFSIEFMFLATLVLAYAVPFQKAMERRKLLKEKENDPPPVKKIIRQEFVKNGGGSGMVKRYAEKKEEIKTPIVEPVVEEFKEKILQSDNPLQEEEPILVATEEVKELSEDDKKILALKLKKRGRGRPAK